MPHPNQYLYVAVKTAVMRGQELIARAKSGKMAQQIAKALNNWTRREESHD